MTGTAQNTVTGGWRDGDHPAQRHFLDLGTIDLENGQQLPNVRIAYQTWGTLNEDASNAVLIEHALTGDAHVHGDAEVGQVTAGWWNKVVGPGRIIDTDRYFVVASNVLGGCQGSTGPASIAPDGKPWGSRFPLATTRDHVKVEVALADYLGIDQWTLLVGASLGGHRALEWAVEYPDRVRRLAIIASGASTTAEQAAWAHTQIAAIELDPAWQGGDFYDGPAPTAGLALARQIAHTTYRSPRELGTRFGNEPQGNENPLDGGRLAVQSYLEHHGDKLVKRFDAGSYVSITRSMLTHDIGRGRGGMQAALSRITAQTLAVAVDSDRLFFPQQLWEISDGVKGAFYREIHSLYGHDGFLIESEQLTTILSEFLYERAPWTPSKAKVSIPA